MRNSERWMWN